MNADDVIELYVADVAAKLPRKLRNDVAFELRALLNEELQGRADEGVAVDAAMATEFVNAFGDPAEVAARYRPAITIIDPSDGRTFLRAMVIGLVIIWALGMLAAIQQSTDFIHALAYWWTQAVIPSLWWPGMLVTGFGISAWTRRRSPQTPWVPREKDRIHGTRAAMILGLIGMICGLMILFEPRWILDFFWGGHAASVAYDALSYTPSFRARQAPWLFVLVALNIPLGIIVLARGRWSPRLRAIELGLGVLTIAMMIWVIADGPILMTATSDQTCKALMSLIVIYMIFHYGIIWYRRVRPAPM